MTAETPQEAARRLAATVVKGEFTAEALHTYRDADGNDIYHRFRVRDAEGKKVIRPFRANGGGYVMGEPDAPESGKPLYRLPELLAAGKDSIVWIVEGENCADALHAMGVVATTSGSASSADSADWTPLHGRRVIIWPDHDTAGRKYADDVARLLHDHADVRIIDLEQLDHLPPGGDCVDWLEVRDSVVAADMVDMPTVAYSPPTEGKAPAQKDKEETRLLHLAELSVFKYERLRKDVAKELGVRAGVLDSEVSKRRESIEEASIVAEVEPWPEAVDGAEVLDKVAETFDKYLLLPDKASHVIALWAAHAHSFECFVHSPRLNITSPEKGCGKTLVLDILQCLTPRAVRAENCTTATLFRLTDKYAPTVLIDEYDSFLKDNNELRGALNAGHKRGGQHLRCEGENNEVRAFRTFAPVALAGIRQLPATLHDRSIVVTMTRAKRGELRATFSSLDVEHEEALNRMLARWCADNEGALRNCRPKLPDGMFNRVADNWRPLAAIAETAGGHWPGRLTAAVRALRDDEDAEDAVTVMLLADIRRYFGEAKVEAVPSADLASWLREQEGRLWPEWRKGNPITANTIARLLKGFSIKPALIRFDSGPGRGYRLIDFHDAFARFLPDQTVTPLQVNDGAVSSGFESVTEKNAVTDEKPLKANAGVGCNSVTGENGGSGGLCPRCDGEGCRWCQRGSAA